MRCSDTNFPEVSAVVSPVGKLVAPLIVILAMAATAEAQVPEQQGFFGNIDGRWMWLGGDRIVTPQGAASRTTSGPGGQMLIGYKLSTNWDVALAGDVQGLLTELTKLRNGTLSVDTNHQHFDLEVGYSNGWWRVNAGLRGIHYNQLAAYNVQGVFVGYDVRDMYGIGPKVGAGARWAVSDNWAIVGGADAALLYTSFLDYGTGVLINNGGYWQFVPQVASEVGLSWRSTDTPSFSFTFGGRVAASLNTAITADGSHHGTLLEFGPFVRMAYNFAGPARHPAMPTPGAAPQEKQTGHQVFFGYERADISLVAAGTIRQAAEDTRRGRPANIQVTSMTASSDVLSLLRAGAVRDELVRNGVPPSQISIAPGGESDPLVPTAGGMQEGKNCRVQITF
jgi:hypothetical protein